MAETGLLFTSDAGAGASTADFIKDAFSDITVAATNNSGLTSTSLTNPTGALLANNDQTLYGSKTLWFKEVLPINDRAKWVNNEPTYQIVCQEDFPAVQVYAFGHIVRSSQAGKNIIGMDARSLLSGFGVTGKIRRVIWILQPSYLATASAVAQLKTDGVNTTTANYANQDTSTQAGALAFLPQFRSMAHQTTNETNDIHDFQILPTVINTITQTEMVVYGVQVYFENAGANIQQNPGTTYVNKTKVVSVNGATFTQAAAGSSLGGVVTIFKKVDGTYGQTVMSMPSSTSIAAGVSGTNLVTVTTGTGGSFLAGWGIVAALGSTHYFGIINSVSTDTLTMGTTTTFGFSLAPVYSVWKSGTTVSVSATYMTPSFSYDFAKAGFAFGMTVLAGSNRIIDFDSNTAVYFQSVGVTNYNTAKRMVGSFLNATTSLFQFTGSFQGMDVEFNGFSGAILNYSVNIDGLNAHTFNASVTGSIKHTVFTEAGPGSHIVTISSGTSMSPFVGIERLNFFKAQGAGSTTGLISQYSIHQAIVNRTGYTPTGTLLGASKRTMSSELYLTGSWSRTTLAASPFGMVAYGSSTSSAMVQSYWGRQFVIQNSYGVTTGSLYATLMIDGVGAAYSFNSPIDPGSEGIHTIQLNPVSGATLEIGAIDHYSSRGAIKSLTNSSVKATNVVTPVKNRVFIHLGETAGQVIGSGAYAFIAWNNIIQDTFGCYSPSDNRVFIPKDGLYFVKMALTTNSAAWTSSQNFQAVLVVNAIQPGTVPGQPTLSEEQSLGLSATSAWKNSYTGVLWLRRGDFVHLQVLNQASGSISLDGSLLNNNMMIMELSDDYLPLGR